eukprot:6196856-Pleurochrysis_carterae.AAC.3
MSARSRFSIERPSCAACASQDVVRADWLARPRRHGGSSRSRCLAISALPHSLGRSQPLSVSLNLSQLLCPAPALPLRRRSAPPPRLCPSPLALGGAVGAGAVVNTYRDDCEPPRLAEPVGVSHRAVSREGVELLQEQANAQPVAVGKTVPLAQSFVRREWERDLEP